MKSTTAYRILLILFAATTLRTIWTFDQERPVSGVVNISLLLIIVGLLIKRSTEKQHKTLERAREHEEDP